MSKLFQCDGIVRRIIHIKLEAENKQDAANKAFKLFGEDQCYLILWEGNKDIWVGPEEQDVDEEIEVAMALDGPDVYWDDMETLSAKST